MNEYKLQLPELKFEIPQALKTFGVPLLNPGNFNPPNIPYNWKSSWELKKTDLERNYIANKDYKLNTPQSTPVKKQSSLGNLAAAAGIQALSSNIADKMTDGMFGDSYIGLNLANIFSQGVSTAGNTMATNIMKGQALTQGLGQNVGQSIKGAALGLGANLVGQGINSIGGDSRLSRGIGLGVATGIVNAPGIINGIKTLSATGKAIKETQSALSAAKTAGDIAKNLTMLTNLNAFKGAQLTNLAGIGASVLGTALGAATGPSKEYGGKYGKITLTADMIYDLGTAAVGFMGPVGLGVSGIMAMNKGLSNLFGSTDGMTVQDAILGSAFMPAPVKWLNMAGATTTGTFNNQSWQNQQKADSFMGNAFGNLGDKFAKARDEAGKTYGTFSSGAAHEALDNINFANSAWNKILAMADLNELQNIRSQYMTSINNQRYAQLIGGAYQPISRGRYGMKILNNATNHNIGMRLLSAAALIDNKQMILSAQGGTKVARPPRMRAHRKGDESKGLTPEEQEWWKLHEEEKKRLLKEETTKKIKEKEEDADKFNQQVNTVMGAMTLQANETPFTGLEYQQAAENLRQEKVEKFHEAEKVGEATLMADLAVSTAPLLQRGFRWVFNKAGLLVKVPNKSSLKGFSFNDLPQEKYVYNNKTGDFDVIAPKKEWIQKGENDLVPDYFVSPEELQRLIASGLSPEEAAEIMQTRFTNSINARPGIFRNLGKNTYGESRVSEGHAQPVYNNRKGVKASLNDAKTTLNTVFHELGGHGSSLNGELTSFKLDNPLVKIMMHNEGLRPQLKPFYQAVKNGDFKLAEKLAPKDGSLKGAAGTYDFKELLKFIKYMEENLEYSARAIGTNMSNHYGMPNGWNEQLLREYFTEESVNNLLKNVWNYGVPITVGSSTAATLYNKSK